MSIIGVIGISLSAILVKYSSAPSAVTAAFRLIWTVGLMTPVVLTKKEIRKEFLEIEKKTLGLCALSGLIACADSAESGLHLYGGVYYYSRIER